MKLSRRAVLSGIAGLAASSARGASSSRMQVNLMARDLSDRALRYVQQIGARHIYVYLPQIPRYTKHGFLTPEDLASTRKQVERFGLRISGFHLDSRAYANLLLGLDGWEKELDDICRTIAAMGSGGVNLLLFNLLVSRVLRDKLSRELPGHYIDPNGRGGVGLQSYDDARASAVTDDPAGKVTASQMWERITRFQKRCVPAAEQARVRLSLHPDDPPVARFWGAEQVLNSVAGLDRYLSIVPSAYSGITLCQGTLQEAGIDAVAFARRFGKRGKIFEAELRGVRGRLPKYHETFMDDGDIDLVPLLRALKDVGYEGMIQVGHVPRFPDDPDRAVANAWSVAYIKGMLAAIQ